MMNLGLPDLVTGDLDSIHPNTVAMLREKSVHIESTPDQDFTDFCKAVKCIKERNAVSFSLLFSWVGGGDFLTDLREEKLFYSLFCSLA